MTPQERAMLTQAGVGLSESAYVFVSYAHVDRKIVRPYVLRLKEQDFRLWWDDGLGPGAEWVRAVADAIAGSSAFLLLVTRGVADSEYCFREILFAQDQRIPTVVNYLESVQLPNRLRFLLSPIPAVVDGHCERDGIVEALRRALMHSHVRCPRGPNETDALGYESTGQLAMSRLGLQAPN
jgi:hypothetical protein